MKIKGKTAVLTGGKRLGAAVARTLAEHGVNFILSYRTSKKIAQKTAEKLSEIGVKAFIFCADLSKGKDVKKLFKFALGKFGRVDILIHMASTFRKTPLKDLNEKIWSEEIGNNLTSAFLCAKQASKIMLKQKSGGHIILFGDALANVIRADRLPYFISKNAIRLLPKFLAKELPRKIKVNCIAPSIVFIPGDNLKKLQKTAQKFRCKITPQKEIMDKIARLLNSCCQNKQCGKK